MEVQPGAQRKTRDPFHLWPLLTTATARWRTGQQAAELESAGWAPEEEPPPYEGTPGDAPGRFRTLSRQVCRELFFRRGRSLLKNPYPGPYAFPGLRPGKPPALGDGTLRIDGDHQRFWLQTAIPHRSWRELGKPRLRLNMILAPPAKAQVATYGDRRTAGRNQCITPRRRQVLCLFGEQIELRKIDLKEPGTFSTNRI